MKKDSLVIRARARFEALLEAPDAQAKDTARQAILDHAEGDLETLLSAVDDLAESREQERAEGRDNAKVWGETVARLSRELFRVASERDEARQFIAQAWKVPESTVDLPLVAKVAASWRAEVDRVTRERDEARAETAKAREVTRQNTLDCEEEVAAAELRASEWRRDANRYARELAEARAELERVAAERDDARTALANKAPRAP